MDPQIFVKELENTKAYFDRSTRCLTEDDSTFAPAGETMSAAQQVAHVAQTIDWFMEGGFRPEGFDMDFEAHARKIMGVTSLAAAREWLDRSVTAAAENISGRTADELLEPMAEGMVMGGQPRAAIIGAIVDHTAHHRGALTVYSRLRGYTPAMPYMEAEALEPA